MGCSGAHLQRCASVYREGRELHQTRSRAPNTPTHQHKPCANCTAVRKRSGVQCAHASGVRTWPMTAAPKLRLLLAKQSTAYPCCSAEDPSNASHPSLCSGHAVRTPPTAAHSCASHTTSEPHCLAMCSFNEPVTVVQAYRILCAAFGNPRAAIAYRSQLDMQSTLCRVKCANIPRPHTASALVHANKPGSHA